MPPYVPYVGLSRSQSLRIGRGPGNKLVTQMNMGDIPTNPQSGWLNSLFYADLGDPNVRRDLQHHSTLGALDSVGTSSTTVYSDLFRADGLTLTPSGSNMTVAVAAGTLKSRFYGSILSVAAQTVTLNAAPALGNRLDYIVVNPAGVVSVISGPADSVAPTYEVWSVTAGAASAGSFQVQFQYNGFLFTSAAIAYNALGSAVATAIQNATGGPGSATFANLVGGTGGITGGGTALPGGPATVTFSAGVEGPVIPLAVDNQALTGGTGAVTRTTVGVGSQSPFPSGNVLVLGAFVVAAGNANAAAASALSNVTLTS